MATLLVVDDLGSQSILIAADLIDQGYNLTINSLQSDSSITKTNLFLPTDGYILLIEAKPTTFSIKGVK